MLVAGVILYLTGPRVARARQGRAATLSELHKVLDAALAAGLCEVIVVVTDLELAEKLAVRATVVLDEQGAGAPAALRAAVDYVARQGHRGIVVAEVTGAIAPSSLCTSSRAWRELAKDQSAPYVISKRPHVVGELIKVDASAFSALPLEVGLLSFVTARRELTAEHVLDANSADPEEAGRSQPPSEQDVAAVERLLGRKASGGFEVVVRDPTGEPVVIKNAPFLDDGTPMPTLYWLVGRRECEAVGRLESNGGVRRAGEAVDPTALSAAHLAYANERDQLIAATHRGPRPSGGVGGTRTGVKCLHAHLAYFLAGGDDPVGRWTAAQLAGELGSPIAAVDIGTNSTRLLVKDRFDNTIERRSIVTRLGENVEQNHHLSKAAIERTTAVLSTYRDEIDRHGVLALTASATAACRLADNADEFLDAAGAVLKVRPRVLSGDDEGTLSYRGATAGFADDDGPFVVLDVGGGSTELSVGTAPLMPQGVVSMPIGSVRVTERFFLSDPPSKEELTSARAHVKAVVDGAIGELRERFGVSFELLSSSSAYGLAGTVASLSMLHAGLSSYDTQALSHYRLKRTDVTALLHSLAGEPLAARRARPGLEPGRADVIVGGALVVDVVMQQLGLEELTYSEADILDGLAATLRRGG